MATLKEKETKAKLEVKGLKIIDPDLYDKARKLEMLNTIMYLLVYFAFGYLLGAVMIVFKLVEAGLI